MTQSYLPFFIKKTYTSSLSIIMWSQQRTTQQIIIIPCCNIFWTWWVVGHMSHITFRICEPLPGTRTRNHPLWLRVDHGAVQDGDALRLFPFGCYFYRGCSAFQAKTSATFTTRLERWELLPSDGKWRLRATIRLRWRFKTWTLQRWQGQCMLHA